MTDRHIIFQGTPLESREEGSIVKATPAIVYDWNTSLTLYGVLFEALGLVTYVGLPCSLIDGWRSINFQERTNQLSCDKEVTAGEEDSSLLPGAFEDILDILAALQSEYPPVKDIVTIWDNLPSVDIRVDFAWELRRAIATGELVDDDREVIERLNAFEKDYKTVYC